jgi:hypothetical protein
MRGATIFEAPAPTSSTRIAGRLERTLCFDAPFGFGGGDWTRGGADATLGGGGEGEGRLGGLEITRSLRGGSLLGGGSLTRLMGGRLISFPFGGVLSVRAIGGLRTLSGGLLSGGGS